MGLSTQSTENELQQFDQPPKDLVITNVNEYFAGETGEKPSNKMIWLAIPETSTLHKFLTMKTIDLTCTDKMLRYILEGKELEFYMKKIQKKKGKLVA